MQYIGLRHGQSVFNLQHLCNDDPQRAVPLTALGERQAAQAAEQLRDQSLNSIYCSPLPRTVQTAEIINAELGLPLHIESGLADIRSGFDGRPVADYMAAIAHDPLHAQVNGGESLWEHFQRVTACLHALAERAEGPVLLVAHEETLRVCHAHTQGLSAQQVIGLPFANCVPYRFAIS